MRWKNALLIVDFDKTITIKVTIALLGQFGADHSTVSKPWSYFTQAYLNDYRQHQSNINPHNIQSMFQHLHSYKPIELASIERINHAKVFQSLTSDMLFNKAKEYSQTLLQPDVISVLQSYPKSDIRIVSVNWSKDWILGFLHSLNLSRHQIYANDIQSGHIVPSIVTSGDKQQTIENIKNDKKVIYVGDSLGDLEPLVKADLGIVIGQDPSLIQAIHDYGLDNLYCVDHWLQIKEMIMS